MGFSFRAAISREQPDTKSLLGVLRMVTMYPLITIPA